jgi:hypothetical protein
MEHTVLQEIVDNHGSQQLHSGVQQLDKLSRIQGVVCQGTNAEVLVELLALMSLTCSPLLVCLINQESIFL